MGLLDDSIFLLNQNGNALDSSGNGHDGVETGVIYSDAETKIYPEVAFYDGIDDIITIDKAGLPSSLSALTVATWVYLNAKNKIQTVFSREDVETYFRIQPDNTLIFRHADLSQPNTVASTALTTGLWYHIGCTWDGINSVIYLNGVVDGGQALTGTINYDNDTDIILGASNVGTNFLDAYMVQALHSARALTATEMSQLWSGGKGMVIPSRQRFIGKRPKLTVDRQIIGNRENPIIR